MNHVDQLASIFNPNLPVQTPDGLFGRDAEVRSLFVAYGAEKGGLPIVIGPPGVGKTSILTILRSALAGNIPRGELVDALWFIPTRRRWVIRVGCTRHMLDGEALCDAILRNLDNVLGRKARDRRYELKDFELEGQFSIVKAKASWQSAEGGGRSSSEELQRRTARLVRDGLLDEVVFIVDECEQLPWLPSLMDFTRGFTRAGARFVFGLRDYASTNLVSGEHGDYRWPTWIPLAGLEDPYVEEFYNDACERLRNLGIVWKLDDEVLRRIIRQSGGEPWYLHMIGQALLFDENHNVESAINSAFPTRLSVADLERAERRVLRSRLSGLHGSLYSELCIRAPKREEVLQSLARYPASIIPRDFVAHLQKYRVASAVKITEELVGRNPPVLLKATHGNEYQFVDHQFRVFCRLTKVLHSGVDEYARATLDAWMA